LVAFILAVGCLGRLQEEHSSALMQTQITPPIQVQAEQLKSTPVPRWRLLPEIRSWSRDILLALATALFVVIFVVQPVKVEGTSMQPRLFDQERIFVNRFIYRFTDISRGDIVVFWYPRDRHKSFIKRVLAVPGDEVEIRHGSVYVNRKRIDEPYLSPEFRDHDSIAKQVVPEGMYFVLGDHRNSSNDSRNWGYVSRDLIYGKAVFRYWPASRVGPVD